jgi:DNA-binding HxlR family transcriptional regulator
MQTARYKRNAYASACPTRLVLDRVADKWAVLILGLLGDGPVRFNQIRRQIEGISQKSIVSIPEKPGA